MRVKVFILALAVALCAAPVLAGSADIGITGYGVTTSYTNVLGQSIVNSLYVNGSAQAFVDFFSVTGVSGVTGIAPASLSQYTYEFSVNYVAGSYTGGQTADYTGTLSFYSPVNGVNLPQYSEKAALNLTLTYNSLFSSAAWDGTWFMANDGARGSDWSELNPLMVVTGTWNSVHYSSTYPGYNGLPFLNMTAESDTGGSDEVVPEASTVLLSLSGLVSVLGFRRLRGK